MISVYSGDRFITERPWQGQEITIARFLQENGLQMDMPCGGHGRCGKCRVLVVGDVLPPEESELKMLSAEERGQGVRLACKAVICGNQVRISLARQKKIDVETHTALENMIWRPWGRGLGLSVDIGTTTVAAYLWDLDAHRQLGVRACKNPQERFGADVVSRLEAALNGNGNALRGDICQCINTLAGELCSGCGHTPEEIHSAVVTGNTTMLYLLCGYDVHDIAFVPFEAAHRFGEFMSSAELGLHMAQDCRVYLPPCISAYVGADISCGLLGAERVLGGFGYMQVNFSPGYGYDGITIAAIANNNPFGCLLMSLLMGLLRSGGTQLNIMTEIPSEWVDMLSAFIFVFVVAANAVLLKMPEWKEKWLSRERRQSK